MTASSSFYLITSTSFLIRILYNLLANCFFQLIFCLEVHTLCPYNCLFFFLLRMHSNIEPFSIVGAMTNLGDFFDNLKNNIDFLEKGELTDEQIQLLDGQHPLTSLKKELSSTSGENDSSWHNNGPHGTAAFIHAIRTYRPSHRIRNLISTVPEGYRGANSHDPNYKWIGLGKRSYF